MGNPNISIQYLEVNPDKLLYWCWGSVSSNPNLTVDLIRNHMEKGWDWMPVCPHLDIDKKEFLCSRMCYVSAISMLDQDANRKVRVSEVVSVSKNEVDVVLGIELFVADLTEYV